MLKQDFQVEVINRNDINVSRVSLDITQFNYLVLSGYFSDVGQMRYNFSLENKKGSSVNFSFLIILRERALEEREC